MNTTQITDKLKGVSIHLKISSILLLILGAISFLSVFIGEVEEFQKVISLIFSTSIIYLGFLIYNLSVSISQNQKDEQMFIEYFVKISKLIFFLISGFSLFVLITYIFF